MNTFAHPVEPSRMTELEERLAAPGGAELHAVMHGRLADLEFVLSRQLAGSVPRAEFDTIKSSLEAARSAREVLQQWPAGPSQSSKGPLARRV